MITDRVRICDQTGLHCFCDCCNLCSAYNTVHMPQSTKERQKAFRARKAAAALHEVRGIFLPQSLHAALKEHARKLLNVRVSPNSKTPAKREN